MAESAGGVLIVSTVFSIPPQRLFSRTEYRSVSRSAKSDVEIDESEFGDQGELGE